MSINTGNLEAKDYIDKSEWKYLMEMRQFISRKKVDPRNPRLQRPTFQYSISHTYKGELWSSVLWGPCCKSLNHLTLYNKYSLSEKRILDITVFREHLASSSTIYFR